MKKIVFSEKSKSSKELGDGFPLNWKAYISPGFDYNNESAFPSLEKKFQEVCRCLTNKKGQDYHPIITEFLVGLRIQEDTMFRTILARTRELGLNLVYNGKNKNLYGSTGLGYYYATINLPKQQQQRPKLPQQPSPKQQQVLKDLEILDYKIGQPISKAEARIHFIRTTIDVSKIPSSQKPMIEGDSIMDPITMEYIPFKDCVQLKEDGYIVSKETLEDFIKNNTSQWQGKENVGFKTPDTTSDACYGNLVLFNFDSEYRPQKSGILHVQNTPNIYRTRSKNSEPMPSHFFTITYMTPQNSPYYFLAGFPCTFYIPNNEPGKKLLLLFIDAFKKGNLFGFCGNAVKFGRVHLKTSIYGGSHSYPDDTYDLRVTGHLRALGVTPYTASFNANRGKWSTADPYPLEKRWQLRWS